MHTHTWREHENTDVFALEGRSHRKARVYGERRKTGGV